MRALSYPTARERYRHGLDDATGQVERGLATAADMLRIDPAHERAHRQAMLLYCMAGDRTRALRQFHTCEKALRKELGVEPERSTIDFYRQIRNEDYAFGSILQIPGGPHNGTGQPSLEEFYARMDELQSIAIESQHQMQQELHHFRSIISRDAR